VVCKEGGGKKKGGGGKKNSAFHRSKESLYASFSGSSNKGEGKGEIRIESLFSELACVLSLKREKGRGEKKEGRTWALKKSIVFHLYRAQTPPAGEKKKKKHKRGTNDPIPVDRHGTAPGGGGGGGGGKGKEVFGTGGDCYFLAAHAEREQRGKEGKGKKRTCRSPSFLPSLAWRGGGREGRGGRKESS